MCPSGTWLRQVCLQPLVKDAGFLCLTFFNCDANPRFTQHPPETLHITPWDPHSLDTGLPIYNSKEPKTVLVLFLDKQSPVKSLILYIFLLLLFGSLSVTQVLSLQK